MIIVRNIYRTIFTCVEGQLPFKYLGVPVLDKKLRNMDRNDTDCKMEKKMGSWQGKRASYVCVGGGSGRWGLIFLSSCLRNVIFYMISIHYLLSW